MFLFRVPLSIHCCHIHFIISVYWKALFNAKVQMELLGAPRPNDESNQESVFQFSARENSFTAQSSGKLYPNETGMADKDNR